MVEVDTRVASRSEGVVDAPPRPIRVLYLFPGVAEGSAMIFAKQQVEALRDRGVCSEIFALGSRTNLFRLHRESRRLRQQIALFQPDLVHAQYGTMTAFLASLTTSVPLVITFRGSDLNPAPSDPWSRSLLRRWLSQYAAHRAARIICVSHALKRRLWWGRDRTMVLPSGVDTDLFFPRSRTEARASLGWDQHERIVLFNAGLSPAVKRVDLAEAAVKAAETLCGPTRLVRLDGRVPHQTVAMMLNGADCLLMTSDWEGSPNIIKEALACNVQIVSVEVGDVRERLAGVTPSRIVERDPGAIAQGIADMLARPQRSNGHAAIASITQNHIARQIVALYRDTLRIT